MYNRSINSFRPSRRPAPVTVELSPADGRKSFYGKAYVQIARTPEGVVYTCYSYDTRVAAYNADAGTFRRLWGYYSATTMRHVNAFCAYIGVDGGGKAWWDRLTEGVDYHAGTWTEVTPDADAAAPEEIPAAA